MTTADAKLEAFAERLRALGKLAPEAAKEAAPLLAEAVQRTAAAGTSPDGQAWPTKRDGSRALPNAASAITAVATGLAIVVRLAGPYVFHHYAKSAFRRRILPDSGAGIPKDVLAVLQEAVKRTFNRLMKR